MSERLLTMLLGSGDQASLALVFESEALAVEADSRFADFGMGVGIATEDAVLGNLGGETRFDYSVVGDTVNLAVRLESLTRQLRVSVLVNEESYRESGRNYVARNLGLLRVKGKKKAVDVWEIVGQESGVIDRSYYTTFSEALDAARKDGRDAAIRQFQHLLELKPDDVAANLYFNLIKSHETLDVTDLIFGIQRKIMKRLGRDPIWRA